MRPHCAFIYIFVVINNVKPFFIHLVIPSWVKYLLEFFAHFLNWTLAFFNFMSSLYTLNTVHLQSICFANIYSHYNLL